MSVLRHGRRVRPRRTPSRRAPPAAYAGSVPAGRRPGRLRRVIARPWATHDAPDQPRSARGSDRPAAASTRGLTSTYGRGENAGPRPARRRPRPAGRPVHRGHGPVAAPASPRSCTAWPAWTPPRPARSRSPARDLAGLDDTALTLFRRDHIGFVFQAFNLLPVLTAGQNVAAAARARGPLGPTAERLDQVVGVLGLADRLGHLPEPALRRPAAAGGASPGRWSPGPTSSSPTSRPATSTARASARCSACCAARSTSSADRRDGHPRARRRGVRRRRGRSSTTAR